MRLHADWPERHAQPANVAIRDVSRHRGRTVQSIPSSESVKCRGAPSSRRPIGVGDCVCSSVRPRFSHSVTHFGCTVQFKLCIIPKPSLRKTHILSGGCSHRLHYISSRAFLALGLGGVVMAKLSDLLAAKVSTAERDKFAGRPRNGNGRRTTLAARSTSSRI